MLALGLAVAACSEASDEPLHNLGNTANDLQLEPNEPPPATLQDFAGTWIGQAEDPLALGSGDEPAIYRFPSGSTQIRLEFTPGEGGTLAFGVDEPPPPPTNFDVGYPEGVDYMSDALWEATVLPPVEGFRYALEAEDGGLIASVRLLDDRFENHAVDDGVFRLFYRQNEIFRPWCDAQTSYPTGLGYDCLGASILGGRGPCTMRPPGVPADDASAPLPLDCGKMYMCAVSRVPICECTPQGCHANAAESVPGLFVRRVGDELVGTFAQSVFFDRNGSLTSLGTVRFRRSQ